MSTPEWLERVAAVRRVLNHHSRAGALCPGDGVMIADIVAVFADWRPIETAPEEGVFLVWMPAERPGHRIQVAIWRKNVKVIGGAFSFDCKPATKWMPIPLPPVE